MAVTIEQRIEDLLGHANVWDETKEALRDFLTEHQAGTLDPDDAKYIEGLHAKMFGGKSGASGSGNTGKPAQGRVRDIAAVKPANDDTAAPSTKRGLAAAELIDALRGDIANLIVPGDMNERPSAEQDLRGEILAALQATLDDLADKKES